MNLTQQSHDGELLAAFARNGSEAAFAELVRRHGAMVYGIALRVLEDHHEAQDVSQAVFVTLAHKAGGLRHDPSLTGWLHRVTICTARDARTRRQRRQQREDRAMQEAPTVEPSAIDQRQFREELDAAIDQLPDRYRRPLAEFHLQGKSLQETARALGLNLSATGVRLARAREMLRKKLVRRGVTVGSVGALTVLLSAESGAAVLPPTIVAATVKAATGGAVSTTVAALSQGALHAMFTAKVKSAVLITAACVVVTGTGIVVAQQATKADKDAPVQQAPALTRAALIAAAPPATNPAQAAPVLRAPALTRDQLIAAADQEASKAWPQHKPNVRAPGFFIPRKPDGCLRDIKVEPQAGLWQVSVVVRLFVAGKENRIGSVSVPLDANGALAGAVQFEGFEGRDGAPAPKTGTTESKPAAPAPSVNEYLAQQTAQLWVNGLLAGRVDQILAVSDVPFCWDKVAVVKTAEELKTKLEAVVQNKGVRNLVAGEAIMLKDQAAAQATEWFKQMETADLKFVTVVVEAAEGKKAGITVAIKPGTPSLKVVGFAD